MPQSTQCNDCSNYYGEFKCAAFPKGIPAPISTGEHDHRKEFEGDNGIRFKSLEELRRELTNSNQRGKKE